MQADWSVVCGADDPMVIIPWASEDHAIHYVDLRGAPAKVDEIPEAAQYPCLNAALLRWNRPDSPLFTAKCDVWNYAADSFDAEDLAGFAYAQASYIDLLARDPGVFSSFTACERMLRIWTERAQSIAVPEGRCEWTLRPARILPMAGKAPQSGLDHESAHHTVDGFATSLYVWGYGSSPQVAAAAWSNVLVALIEPIFFPSAR